MLQSVTRPYPQTQCRAVSGVGVSWVKSSNCFRRLEQSALPSIFDIRLSSVMAWNLQSCPTTVLNEWMWHIWGSAKHTLTPPVHISRASRPSNDQNLRNCAHRVSRSQPGNYLPPPNTGSTTVYYLRWHMPPFMCQVLRPIVGPVHETAGTGKLINAALLSFF